MISFLRKLISRLKQSKKGPCELCGKLFHEKNLHEVNSLYVCHKHKNYLKQHQWIRVYLVKCSPQSTKEAIDLQNQRDLLRKNGILSYVKASYEINKKTILTTLELYIPKNQKQKCLKLTKDKFLN
mgnify:CR=1 FL=1